MKKIILVLFIVTSGMLFCADVEKEKKTGATPVASAAPSTTTPISESERKMIQDAHALGTRNGEQIRTLIMKSLAREWEADEREKEARNRLAIFQKQQERKESFEGQLEALPGEIVNAIPKGVVAGVTHGISYSYVAPRVAQALEQFHQTFMPIITQPVLNWLKPKQKKLTLEEQKKYNDFRNAQESKEALNKALEYKRRRLVHTQDLEEKKKIEAEIKAYEAALAASAA